MPELRPMRYRIGTPDPADTDPANLYTNFPWYDPNSPLFTATAYGVAPRPVQTSASYIFTYLTSTGSSIDVMIGQSRAGGGKYCVGTGYATARSFSQSFAGSAA